MSSNCKAPTHADEADEQVSDSSKAKDIIRISVNATKSLASLSRREALNAVRILKEQRAMDGLVLSLLIKHDLIGAAAFIVEKLSKPQPARQQPKQKLGLSLRHRMVNSKQLGSPQTPEKPARSSRLYQELSEDKDLAEKSRRSVSQHIIRLINTKPLSLGEGCLFIQAY